MKKRHIIQLIFFITSIILLILCARQILSDVHEYCPYSFVCIGLNSLFMIITPAMIIGCLIVLSTLFFGRWFCSYVCYFGSLSEFLYFCIPSRKIKVSRKVELTLGYFRYVVLIATVVMSWLGAVYFIDFCPHIILTSYKLIFWVGLFLLLVLSVFVCKIWCRYLCPFGALQSLMMGMKRVKKRNG